MVTSAKIALVDIRLWLGKHGFRGFCKPLKILGVGGDVDKTVPLDYPYVLGCCTNKQVIRQSITVHIFFEDRRILVEVSQHRMVAHGAISTHFLGL
jgi:hypothetical protein